jgi:Nucleotidyl transferase AbiEii toxin, Type IV TA system
VRALLLEDTVGLKARAWHDRFVVRDIIDLHAVASTFSYIDPGRLARRHEPDLDLETVLDHLAGVSVFPDEDFAATTLMNRKSPIFAGGSQDGMTIWLAVSPRNILMNFQMTCNWTG